jgi:hypothetical protein
MTPGWNGAPWRGGQKRFWLEKRMVSRDLLIANQWVYKSKPLILLDVSHGASAAHTQRTNIAVLRLKMESAIAPERAA